MAESVTGLRLLSAASSEPQAIPGLLGLWSTEAEQSVVPADLGADLADLKAQAEALGFEVEEVEWEREVTAAVLGDDNDVEMKVSEIRERIEEFDTDTLARLASDSRKGAREAAEAEIERRAEAGGASQGVVGQVGAVEGWSAAPATAGTSALTPASPAPAQPTDGSAGA